MKFSIWPNPARPMSEVLDIGRHADDDGWHGIWYADHYMPNTGGSDVADGDVFECWAVLAGLAVATHRVRLGSLVSPTSVHHPALLANRAATIDHLSEGRLVLGLGAGWQINEHGAYGIELEPPRMRVDRFDEAIQIVRSLLSDGRTSFSGEHYTITDAPCDPSPVQQPLPLLVGTASPRMLRITARHADEWNTWGAPDLATASAAKFTTACDAVGVDPASKWRSVQALVFMTEDQQLIDGVMAGEMADRSIAGPVDHIVEQLGAYADAGFDEFVVPDFTLGDTAEERFDALGRFRSEIAAQLD
ncbi:MAG: LLM class flavin-dependent oxidoreductase [Acidimicrobiia bacterium]|nr:LLM class flavin-dependent oxidoreductase [Acidimicrobiia bacterium]